MLEEKLLKKIKTINENFINLGFDLEEDLIELVTQREDIKDRIENTKYKKMILMKAAYTCGKTLFHDVFQTVVAV